jgi:hypothetical protein
MIVQRATPGAKGVDTILTFTPKLAAKFKAAGFDFVVRYVEALTVAERDIILNAGLALLGCGYSMKAHWTPSSDLGTLHAKHQIEHAVKCGLPSGMSLYCDLEGPNPLAGALSVIAYVNAWADVVQGLGYKAGLYVGYGVPLSAYQLYWHLKVTGYWHSCSRVQDVAVRGYQMIQQSPGNQTICGALVDVDIIQPDQKGETPNWLIGAP